MHTRDTASAPDRRAVRSFVDLLGQEAVVAPPDGLPGQVIVQPGSAEEVAGVLRVAGEVGLRVYPVGGGPACRGLAGVVLDLSQLSAVVELNAKDMLVVAQAGAPLRVVAATAEASGLSYPPAFLACRRATVGGSLARGGGVRGPRYGPGRDYALALKAVLPGGEVTSVGSRAIKNATGYNLTQLLVGSWGALGVIVEATLRLVPKTSLRRSYLVGLPDAPTAAGAALALLKDRVPPAATELLDRRALDSGCPDLADLLPARAGAALLVLLEGAGEPDLVEQSRRLLETLHTQGHAESRALDEAEAETAWEARRELRTALTAAHPDLATVELALPLATLPSFVGQVRLLASRNRVDVALSGSVASGALEIAAPGTEGGMAAAATFCQESLGAARAVGGQLVAAGGTGLTYSEWIELALPPAAATMLRQVKAALDPMDILRPAAF